MSASDLAMSVASEALGRRQRFVAEEELDASLALVQQFLAGRARRLIQCHSFVHYASVITHGTFVQIGMLHLVR